MKKTKEGHYLVTGVLTEGKTKEVLELIESFIGKGIDVKRLTYDLMICLKDAIVYRSTSDESLLERLNGDYAKQILLKYSFTDALNVTNILNEARNNYRLSTNYRLFFEISSLKIIGVLASNPYTFENKEIKKEEIKKEEVKVAPEPTKKEEVVEISKQEEKVEPEKKEEKVEEVKKEEKPTTSYSVPKESEEITYSIEEYVNILCQGDKRFKEELSAKWPDIRKFIDKPETRYIAQLLSDSVIGVANKEFIMLIYDFKLLATRAKQKNNLILIRKFILETFGFDLEVYAVERSTFIDITNKYFELRQARKLPIPHKIPRLELNNASEEKKKIQEDETIELGKALFGDQLEIE